MKQCTGFLCFVEKQLWPSTYRPAFLFEAITDMSSDADPREEQNGGSNFLIGVTVAKLCPFF